MSTEAIELMLADLRWTRRLAVTLARDASEADDLWSETWSAAGREQKKVQRGWIATTMRNVVRMRRRAEVRRLTREAATADLAVEPHTPEELLARVELQRLLAELVTSLSEPYRTTLLLHHVEDLAPVEIARRLAIPAGTVRWRLKVAHDELRDRLIARSGGDRDAWRLALLPLVPGARRPPLGGDSPTPGHTAPGKGAKPMWKMMAVLGSTIALTGGAAAVHHAGKAPTMLASAAGAKGGATAKSGGQAAAPSAGKPAAATGAAASKSGAAPAKSGDDRVKERRAFAVPSAAIADFEAPDLDACFTASPKSDGYRRVDVALTLKAEGATATIANVAVKHVSDELAGIPGLADCLRKKLVGHDMPAPGGNGPAELAVLVHDDCPRSSIVVEPGPAGGGPVASDAQAPSLGDTRSKLTITVFTDFQCPFCWRFAARLESLAQLYPGQLRIEVRNYPLPFHTGAELAAEAALAANEQGKFWPMHDELFANQNAIDREHLRGMAQKLGLDVARFERALDDGHERARVQSDIALGDRVGVKGVPATVIGDELVPGALPLEEMVRHIDRALASKNK